MRRLSSRAGAVFDNSEALCYDWPDMGKHVLLVAPYVHDFAAFDLWLKPLGLLYVAAAALEAGYDTRVVNCLDRLHPESSSASGSRPSRSYGDGRGKFRSEIIAKPASLAKVPRQYKRYGVPLDAFRRQVSEGPRPDAIGVGSMMTYWWGGVAETIALLRDIFPDSPVILGGVYATLCAEHARRLSGADIVVKGPGEEKFVDVLRGEIGGNGGGKTAPARLRPAYHLLGNLDSVSMLTSFGCPFSCAYCASRLLRRGFFQRPVRDVVEEIAHYAVEMKIKNIAFYDDALLVNAEKHIKLVLREVLARGLKLRFHTPNGLHASMIDGELAALMWEAGFATVRLSVESMDEARLKDSCMKVTPKGFETAISHLTAAGYDSSNLEAYVLMGAPGQCPDEVERTIRFVHETGVAVRLADFSPIPGTEYFRAAVGHYGIDPAEPLYQNSSVLPHLVPSLREQYQVLKQSAKSMNSTVRGGALKQKPSHGRRSAANERGSS